MNRRTFLQSVLAASTTAYFLAPIGGWHSDVIAHADPLSHDELSRRWIKIIKDAPPPPWLMGNFPPFCNG